MTMVISIIQKKIIVNSFKDGSSIDELSKEFKCTESTIIRNIKKYNENIEIYFSKIIISVIVMKVERFFNKINQN